jgi:O-antigen/teichoic acid export membrane protein
MSDQQKDIKRFFKHSYIYAIGNIINRIGAFLLLPVYTNYLTVAEYGSLELFYAVSSVIFGFLSVGIAHATLRFYFEYKDIKDRHAVVSTNYIASFILSLVGVSLVAIWYEELSILVFDSTDYSLGVLIILGTIVFELSSQICLAYVRAVEKSLFFVYIAIAKLVIQISINIYLVIYANQGVVGILFGNFMAVFIGWLILTVFTLKYCKFHFHLTKLIPILQYSFPFLLGTFTEMISSNVDKFGLNYLDTIGTVGIYMLAIKFSMIIEQLVGEPFNRSYGSFRFSIMDNDNANEIQSKIVKYLLYASMFFALGLSLFVRDLLVVISNESFWAAADIVPLVVLASVIKIMNYPVQTGILYAKKTRYFFYIGVIAAVVSAVLNLSLIPFIGIYGACIALIVTNVVGMVLMHKKSQEYFEVHYDYKKMIMAVSLAIIIYLASRISIDFALYLSIPFKAVLLTAFVLFILKSNIFLDKEEKLYVSNFINNNILSRIR